MNIDVSLNIHWYKDLKDKLTQVLGYEIGEPEDGFEFKYDWD